MFGIGKFDWCILYSSVFLVSQKLGLDLYRDRSVFLVDPSGMSICNFYRGVYYLVWTAGDVYDARDGRSRAQEVSERLR